jgi:hypothetical protein
LVIHSLPHKNAGQPNQLVEQNISAILEGRGDVLIGIFEESAHAHHIATVTQGCSTLTSHPKHPKNCDLFTRLAQAYHRNMRAWHYYRDVARMAFSHSVERAHAIIFLAITIVGVTAYFVPGLHMNMEGPEIAALVLASIVGPRLVMAPYWLHQEQERRIPKTRAEWQRSNTKLTTAWSYIAAESKFCLGFNQPNSFGEAREILKQTIRNGEIDVWGKRQPQDVAFEKIPTDYWKEHQLITIDESSTSDHRDFSKRDGALKYYDIHVDRDEITRCWPRATKKELRRLDGRVSKHRATQRI